MDEREFETIVNAHYEGLYRFALSLVRQQDQACDLTQETFYRWATKGLQLKDPTKVKTWLFTTLYRQFLMTRRRETRFPHAEISAAESELPPVEPPSADRFDASLVMDALAEIDETYRAPLTLFYLGDHSYREIASTLDIPIGTVMSRLSRGKAVLRERLAALEANGERRIILLKTQTGERRSTS